MLLYKATIAASSAVKALFKAVLFAAVTAIG